MWAKIIFNHVDFKASKERLINVLCQKKMSTSIFLLKNIILFPFFLIYANSPLAFRSSVDSQLEQWEVTEAFHARAEKR